MKKWKLLASLCALVFTFACLTFGVYAMISASFTASGTVIFNAYELDILVHGQILGAVDNGLLVTDYKNATINNHGKTDFTVSEDGTLPIWEMGGLAFDELNENNLITIKFTITNYSDYALEATATIEGQSALESNLKITNTPIAYCYAAENAGAKIDSRELILTFAPKASAAFNNDLNISIDIFPSSKDITTQGFTTSASAGNNIITQYSGTSTDVVIPTIIGDKAVTQIGENAFKDRTDLTSIAIPNGVTSIGKNAFYGCTNLTSITIPNSVTSIGNSTFNNCSNLSSITIPSSVTWISSYAFYNCSNLSSIIIPSSVTRMGEWVFAKCSSLTSITIPDGVPILHGAVFKDCTNLTSITIPSSVTSIGGEAFSGCSKLSSITIPSSVTSIGSYVFYNCSNLISITIPSSVESIGNYAFHSCSSLSSITIPSSVTSIGDQAFYNCGRLTSITIPSSVTSIGERTFAYCSRLTSITIPDSVTSIGLKAFRYCTSLISITIPNSVTSIGEYAFSGCSRLSSITIPNSVESIGNYAFIDCGALNSVYIDSSTIANSLTSKTAGGYIINYLNSSTGKLYIKSDIPEESIGSYVNDNFTKATSPVPVNGVEYYVYKK